MDELCEAARCHKSHEEKDLTVTASNLEVDHTGMGLIRPSISMLLRPLVANQSRSMLPSLSTTTAHPVSTTATPFTDRPVESTPTNPGPKVLLLEGDSFAVSHDGIARTGYHLSHPVGVPLNPPPLAIEEQYNLQSAHKTFLLRHHTMGFEPDYETRENLDPIVLGKQAVGVAPLGASFGCLEIQEIDEGTFGSAGTGATTWEASIAMGLYFMSNPEVLDGNVIELGCGVGFGSILTQVGSSLAGRNSLSSVKSVTLTDGNQQVLDRCRENVNAAIHTLNCPSSLPDFHIKRLLWDEASFVIQKYDCLIACDVAYLHSQVNILVQAIQTLLKEGGKCHLFGPYNRSALQEVCRALQEKEQFEVEVDLISLERYRLKPLSQRSAFVEGHQNAYQSKSTATFLHATVRKVKPETRKREKVPNLEEID